MNKKHCPKCTNLLKSTGFACSGHTIYYCPTCNRTWEIKEHVEEESTK